MATPQDVLPVVAAGMPEMMTAPLAATDAGTASLRNLDYGRFAEIVHGQSPFSRLVRDFRRRAKRSNSSGTLLATGASNHSGCRWSERL